MSAVRVESTRKRVSSVVVSIGLYCVASALVYRSVGPFSSSKIVSCACGDPAQEVWFLAWPAYALAHGHNVFFSNWIYYPTGANLGVNPSYPLLGLLASPVTLTMGAIFSYSLFMWLALPVSATSMMFVLRRWTGWWPASFVGGLLYGFSPYMIGHGADHLYLTFVPIPPLVLLTLDELLVRQERSARRYGIGLGLLAAAQFFISPEVLVTSAVVSAVGVVALVVARPREVRERLRHAATGLAYAVVPCAALLSYPAWVAFAGAQHIIGPPNPLSYIRQFRGDLAGAILPTTNQLISPGHLGNALSGNTGENGLYLGVPLLIVLAGFAIWLRRSRLVRFLSVMLLASYVLSLGYGLVVDGHHTLIPLPWIVPVHLPILQDAISARFSLYTALFAAAILPVGLERLHAALASSQSPLEAGARLSWRGPTAAAAASMVVAAFALAPLIPSSYFAGRASAPPLLASSVVRRIPKGSAVLFYPDRSDPVLQGTFMLVDADASFRFKLYGGYALIPGADGAPTATAAPMKQSATLQQVFAHAFAGSGPLPPYNATTARAIRSAILLNDVGTVVVEHIGSDSQTAVEYLTAALGSPERVKGATIWFDARTKASVPS